MTRRDRFELGDYPMVCVRSGRPATKMVPVEAARSAVWPYFFLIGNLLVFLAAKAFTDSAIITGRLPFAEGEVRDITATYEKRGDVLLKGVHPVFVEATRMYQGKSRASTRRDN